MMLSNAKESNYVSLYNKYWKEYNEYAKRLSDKRLISERKGNNKQPLRYGQSQRLSLHEHNNNNNTIVTEMNVVNSELKTLRKLHTMNSNNISTTRKRNYDNSLDSHSNSNNILLNTRMKLRDTSCNYYSSVIETEGNNASNGRSTMLNQYNGISRMSNTLYAHKRKVADSLSLSNFYDNNNNNNTSQQRKRKFISSLSPSNTVVSNVNVNERKTITTMNNPVNSIENDCVTYRNNKMNVFGNDNDSKPRSQFSTSMKVNKNSSVIDKAFGHVFPRTKTYHHISKLKDKPFTTVMLNNNKSSFINNNNNSGSGSVITTQTNKCSSINNNDTNSNATLHQLMHYTFPSFNMLYTPTNTHHNHKQYLNYQQQSSTLTKPHNNNNNHLTQSTTQRDNNTNTNNNALNLILNLNSSTSTTTSTTIHNNNNNVHHHKMDEQQQSSCKDEFTKLMQAVTNIERTTKAITSMTSTSPNNIKPSSSLAHISFHLISSYNIYAGQIGLTEIQLYDINNNKIPIIHAYATSITSAITNRTSFTKISDINRNLNTILIKKLFNNKYHTVNEHDMWLSPFAPDLKIEVFIDNKVTLKKIVIWNYNGKDVNKGVKDIAVYQKDAFIWKGIVNKGCNDDKKDYSTVIDVHYWNTHNKVYTARKSIPYSNTASNTNSARNKLPLSTHMLFDMNNSFNIINSRYSDTKHKKTLFTSSNLDSPCKQHKHLPLTSKYITFNHILITLTSNYGHSKYIGLTGIQFYDEHGNIIDIVETASTIGANPKDINSYYTNVNDHRIFENVFNNKTFTCNDDQMWLTLITPYEHYPYIELTFTPAITVSKIKFFNYNAKNDLDKCVKTLDMKFYFGNDVNALQTIDNIVLHPGIGESGVDYSQDVIFPYTKHFTLTSNELEPYMQVKLASFLYEQCYETPYLPCGFVLRFSFVSNYGDRSEIGVDSIEVYDQLGRDVISKYRSKIRIECNSSKVNDNNDERNRTGMMLKYNNIAIEKEEDDVCEGNNVYMFFRIPIGISYIRVVNHRKEPLKGVKDVKVYMDNNVIYEGYLYKMKEEGESTNEGNCSNDKGETLILFTCDMGITKYLDDMYIAKPLTRVKKDEIVNANGVVLQL